MSPCGARAGYRKILDAVWRAANGEEDFETVKYSKLVKVAEGKSVSKKTYNDIVSPLRCAFDYGYRDHPEKHNPASGLKGFRITKKDRPVVDPFTIAEAEAVIAAIHRDWGEAQGNYDEFRFSPGCDLPKRSCSSSPISTWSTASSASTRRGSQALPPEAPQGALGGIDRCQIKTREDRRITPCPEIASSRMPYQSPT